MDVSHVKQEANKLFAKGDMVLYGNLGVCQVQDIRPRQFGEREVLYYVLKPEEDETSTIYCPVASDKIRMRRLLSREEVLDLIRTMPDTEAEWIQNDQTRQEKFREALKDGTRRDLVKLIKTLHMHRTWCGKAGKKFHAADKKIMEEAESLLYGEFAHVLQIRPCDVLPFIMGELEPERGS
jgi:CarD family transcriptional regulator